jgi:N-sulfoglucosamine sulfohydrolase
MRPRINLMISRVLWWVCVCITLVIGSAFAAVDSRPSFVVLIADDMAWEDCGPYGNKAVRTPNIDRLAEQGMRFNHAFVTTSSCSPSRASIMTGRYPHNTGAEQLHWPLPREQITFVERLKAHGYWTAAAGKWHLGPHMKNRFDAVAEAGTAGFQLPTTRGAKRAMIDAEDESGCANWLPALKSRSKNKPFFLWLAALDPHRDYQRNAIAKPHKPEDVVVPPYLPDTPEVRGDLALYYDEITRLDDHIGKVLAELDAQGIASNTVVIFMADNGRPFPRCKTTVYDSGIRTSFIVRWPARVKAGTTCDRLISSIDIAPTLLELAGVERLKTFQGHSFTKLLDDPTTKIREYAFAEHNWHDYDAHKRAVRSEQFKYIRNFDVDLPNTPPADAVRSPTFQAMRKLRDSGKLTPAQMACFVKPKPAEELYDCDSDPHELRNLAGDRAHAETLKRLRDELARWQKETNDPVPGLRNADEFDRETGEPLPNRQRPRPSKWELLNSKGKA